MIRFEVITRALERMVFPVIGIGLFKSSISGCTRSVCNAVGMEYGNGVAVSVPGFF